MGGASSRALPEEIQRKFPTIKTADELQQLFIAAQLSDLAYKGEEEIDYELDNAKGHVWFSVDEWSSTSTEAAQRMLIATNRSLGTLFVSFKGTKTVEDWLTDIAAVLSPCPLLPGTLIHKGFLARLMTTPWKAIAAAAKRFSQKHLKGNPVSVVVTGHSLGGSLAQLTAACLLLHYPQLDVTSFTFGQPLVGSLNELVDTRGWQQRFQCWIHARDPIPFIFRDIPRMQVTGVVVMLSAAPMSRTGMSAAPQVSVVGTELFRRHEWRSEGGSNLVGLKGARDALNLLKGGVEMKQNHQMNKYLSLLSELLKDHLQDMARMFGSVDPSSKGRCIRSTELVDSVVVTACEASFLMNGDLRVRLKGEALDLAVLASLEHTNSSVEPGRLSNRQVTSSKLRSLPSGKPGDALEVVFRFPDDYKLNSSAVTLRITNWFHVAKADLTIPFNTVWIVGKTGAGKTELRHAFERELVASKPSTSKLGRGWLKRAKSATSVLSEAKQGPRVHVVPEKHEEEERAFEYDRIHLYEFNGFTDFSSGDSRAFLTAVAKHPPRMILLVLNVADTLTDKERTLLIKFIEHIRDMKSPELPIWFVFTHVSMVDERIRPKAISDLKKELKILDSRDRCFFVDSVEFKSGPVSIPTQGVPELYAAIFEKLAQLDSIGMTAQNRRTLIINAFKAMMILAWQNKQTIVTTLMGMGGFVYYGLKLTGRL